MMYYVMMIIMILLCKVGLYDSSHYFIVGGRPTRDSTLYIDLHVNSLFFLILSEIGVPGQIHFYIIRIKKQLVGQEECRFGLKLSQFNLACSKEIYKT